MKKKREEEKAKEITVESSDEDEETQFESQLEPMTYHEDDCYLTTATDSTRYLTPRSTPKDCGYQTSREAELEKEVQTLREQLIHAANSCK